MRKELNLMETIERYIRGEMTKEEKATFEQRLSLDVELQKEMQLQLELMEGIERMELKQLITNAFKKHKMKKKLRNWGWGGFIAGLLVAVFTIFNNSNPTTQTTIKQPLVQSAEDTTITSTIDVLKTVRTYDMREIYSDENLQTQHFSISNNKDTILKSKSGVAIHIDKNTFVNEKGEKLNGVINLEFKEALTPYDIVMANLVTKWDDLLLESGGMIYMNASTNTTTVKIAGNKSVTLTVPSQKIKKNMQVFEGVIDNKKTINWVKPRPLLQKMTPVAIGQSRIVSKSLFDDESSFPSANTISEQNGKGSIAQPRDTSINYNSFAEDQRMRYMFSISKLGWANIDRLANDSRTKEIRLITKVENQNNFDLIYISIVFPNQKIFIPGYEKKNKTYCFTHGDYETTKLPIGETAIIMATSYDKSGRLYMAKKRFKVEKDQEIVLSPEEVMKEELKKAIWDELKNYN